MNTRKNVIVGLVFLFFFSMVGNIFAGQPVRVYANEIGQEAGTPGNEMFEPVENSLDPGLPTATIDDINQWTERKGFEIIGALQKFVQPLAIVIFIVCGLMAMFGAFGNGKMVSNGVMGMVTALILYVVVLYAPEIMDMFLNFVKS